MKKRRTIVIMLIVFLVVGFAAVSTTLVINGLVDIGEAKDDFDVVFTKIDAADDSYRGIKDSGKTIEFETGILTKVDEEYTLTYEVTNTSRNYDADVNFNITVATEGLVDVDYLPKSMQLTAGESKTGYIKVRLLQALTESKEIKVTLKLNAGALGRNSLGSYSKYRLPGMLMSAPSSSDEDQKFWAYKNRISKIVFENEKIDHTTSEDLIFDVSAAQDGSVMAYLISSSNLSAEEKDAIFEEYLKNEEGITVEEYRRKLVEEDGHSEKEANWMIAMRKNSYIGLSEEEREYYFNAYIELIAEEAGITLEELKKQLMEERNLSEEQLNELLEEEKDNLFPSKNFYNLYIYSDTEIKAPVDSSYLFSDFVALQEIEGLNIINTTEVNSMSMMFSNCQSLSNINLSNFNTSKVTNMSGMFNKCENLTELNVSGFDTSNVTDMSNMFSECSRLADLDIRNFNTSKVTNMSHLFYDCQNFTTLDVSSFSTSSVKDISSIFENCSSLTSIDVSKFDTSNVENMSSMFRYCGKITDLDVSKFNTSKVTDMSHLFGGCYGLINIDVSNFNTSNVTNMHGMFYGNWKVKKLDVSHFDTSKVTDTGLMFDGCMEVTELDVSNFDTSKVTNMVAMFQSCGNLKQLDLSNFDTSKVTAMNGINKGTYIIEGGILDGCSSLEEINLDNFNTSNLTSLTAMFASCSNLKKLSIKNFDVSNVTEMYDMFYNCSKLVELDISNWNIETIIGKEIDTKQSFSQLNARGLKIYVKDEVAKNWLLEQKSSYSSWTTETIVIKS